MDTTKYRQSLTPLDQLIEDLEALHPKVTMNNKPLPDTGKRSQFSTGAVRDASEGKGIPSLIPIDALRAVSKRFEDGATKYGRNNGNKGSLLVGSLTPSIATSGN